MKNLTSFLLLPFFFLIPDISAQSREQLYDITISSVDEMGREQTKRIKIKGNFDQSELDALVQENLSGNEIELDVDIKIIEDADNSGIRKTVKEVSRYNTKENKSTFGIEVQERMGRILITKVKQNGSAAQLAGVKTGDYIIKMDKEKVRSLEHFVHKAQTYKVGDKVKLQIRRNGKKIKTQLLLQPVETTEEKEIIIIKKKSSTGAPQEKGVIKISSFELSPNPSIGKFEVNFTSPKCKTLTVRVISLEGNIIEEQVLKDFGGVYRHQFNLSTQQNGIYLFQIEKNKQLFTKRFTLERS